MTNPESSRREFLTGAIAGSLAFSAAGRRVLAATRQEPGGIPTRPLGRNGERVSIVSLGGWHIGSVEDPAEAIRIMHAAIDQGVTFFDNAWDYHDGGSEEIMGRALAQDGKREQVFLMTKNCERDYEGSLRNLDESLRRLRTDHLDLWQFHEMVYDNAPDWVFEKGGIRAAEEARRAGKVRHIGFTGHKDPRIHLKMLGKDFAWDTSQMPVNVMDAHYRSFQHEVIPVCLEKGVSVIGMKSLGGGFPRAMIPEGTPITARDCLRYALSQPIASLVTGMTSMEDLEQAVAVARDFQPLDESETAALLKQAKPLAGDGRFERFKSTQAFDGVHHRRQHGFG